MPFFNVHVTYESDEYEAFSDDRGVITLYCKRIPESTKTPDYVRDLIWLTQHELAHSLVTVFQLAPDEKAHGPTWTRLMFLLFGFTWSTLALHLGLQGHVDCAADAELDLDKAVGKKMQSSSYFGAQYEPGLLALAYSSTLKPRAAPAVTHREGLRSAVSTRSSK